ncbi:MAG: hypothetical protein HYZ27_03040 [Deltaproteobacteria bacterium]|nr:hypothetical protein [Deltaproteobacteria bacterium]
MVVIPTFDYKVGMSRTALPLFVLVTLVASPLLSTWRTSQVASPAALDAVEVSVRRAFRDGDLVLAEPHYLGYARMRLGDLPLWEPRHVVADDLATFRRVHVLSFAGWEKFPELLRLLRLRQGRSLEGRRKPFQHSITHTTFDLATPERVVFDLRRDIEQVRVVSRYPDGTEAVCDRFDRDRWLCPRDFTWSYVGRETLDIDHQPRECVWMHPLARGGVLRVELPAVAASNVLGGFGFTRDASRRASAPVHVRLVAGDEEVFASTHPVVLGWRHFQANVPTSVPLFLEVTTTHNGASHFCLNAVLTEPAP